MPKATISVIITGATGHAGSGVLHACLGHPAVGRVTALTRRALDVRDDKLVEVVHDDFLDYSRVEDRLAGQDACFWCLGVSSTKVRREEDYRRITYDYTIAAAKVLERLSPGMTFCFLSGMGTDETQGSRMMWARVKGKAEADLTMFDLQVYAFRPAFIHPLKGHRSSTLTGSILYPFIRNSKKYCVEADEMGLAMVNAALHSPPRHTLENPDIRELAKMRG
jgi:uncharacterized protein YbjT (DUF2867 family)